MGLLTTAWSWMQVTLRVPERRIGDLEHSDRARRGRYSSRDSSSGASSSAAARQGCPRLRSGERGEELGRDHGGGMLAKERAVTGARSPARLRERTAHREKISDGLRTVWTIQFAAPQSTRMAIASARTRIAAARP